MLAPTTEAEPVVRGWHAWSVLLSPMTAALAHANSHLPLLRSYVDDPEIHFTAASDPSLAGGSFVAVPPARAEDVAALLRRFDTEWKHLVDVAHAFSDFDRTVAADATGMSLAALYERVPAALRGAVELVYDLHDRARVRLIEPLLYGSDIHDVSGQSILLRRPSNRPFILTTPRIDGDHTVERAFADPRLDVLFGSRLAPTHVDDLVEATGLDAPKLLESGLFVEPADVMPRRCDRPDEVRVRVVGHACVLIESRDAVVLIDPLVPYAGPSPVPQLTFADLPDEIDLVLLSHAHQDHLVLETLLQLRHRIGRVVVPKAGSGDVQDPSIALMLRACGFRDVVELDECESLQLHDGEVVSLPFLGEHADLAVRAKATYVVRIGSTVLMFGVDSFNADTVLYERLRRIIGTVDVAFIGMECVGAPLSWAYGAFFDRPVPHAINIDRRTATSDARRAFDVVRELGAKRVVVYAMGYEPWVHHLLATTFRPDSRQQVEADSLVAMCLAAGVEATQSIGASEVLVGP